jgi:hypothetical protein
VLVADAEPDIIVVDSRAVRFVFRATSWSLVWVAVAGSVRSCRLRFTSAGNTKGVSQGGGEAFDGPRLMTKPFVFLYWSFPLSLKGSYASELRP